MMFFQLIAHLIKQVFPQQQTLMIVCSLMLFVGGGNTTELITVPDMYSTTFMEPNTPYFLRMIKEYNSSELFESEEIQIRTQAATHPFPGGISRTRLHPVYATSLLSLSQVIKDLHFRNQMCAFISVLSHFQYMMIR